MKNDLIFHLVSRRKWRERQHEGYYRMPADESSEAATGSEQWIRCYTPAQVQMAANELFRGRKRILLLVINCSQLTSPVRYSQGEGESFPMVEERVNLDAVIDKITLMPDEEGLFDIDIEVG